MSDRAAAGEIDGHGADPALIEKARTLSLHRYDWWIKSDGYPEGWNIGIPAKLDKERARTVQLDDPMPWTEWDLSTPIGHYILHFSGDKIESMWKGVSTDRTPSSQRLSRLNAALSFVWSLINRARGLENDDQQVHMNVSFGLRNRLSSPLPDRFLGSPIIMTHVSSSGAKAYNKNLTPIA